MRLLLGLIATSLFGQVLPIGGIPVAGGPPSTPGYRQSIFCSTGNRIGPGWGDYLCAVTGATATDLAVITTWSGSPSIGSDVNFTVSGGCTGGNWTKLSVADSFNWGSISFYCASLSTSSFTITMHSAVGVYDMAGITGLEFSGVSTVDFQGTIDYFNTNSGTMTANITGSNGDAVAFMPSSDVLAVSLTGLSAGGTAGVITNNLTQSTSVGSSITEGTGYALPPSAVPSATMQTTVSGCSGAGCHSMCVIVGFK